MKKILLLSVVLILLSGCNNKEFLKRLQENEENVHNPTTTEELELAISKYERRIDDIMLAQNRVAIWYKMLGSRYIDAKMYKKAVEAFLAAIEYYPTNHNLYYQLGLSASQVAKTGLGFSFDNSKEDYLLLAVTSYTKCIELEPSYTKASYALAVIYTYELGEPKNAISLLESVVEKEPKNYDAYFVLGASYYLLGDTLKAKTAYQYIAENAKDKSLVESAKRNILELESIY